LDTFNNTLHSLSANLASGYLVSAGEFTLEGLQLWVGELLTVSDGSYPEAKTVSEELASSSSASALDVRSGTVVLQARAWTRQVLSAAVCALASVCKEGVTHPQGVVAGWAVWRSVGLRVNGKHRAWRLANVAPRDVWSNVDGVNCHSWNWFTSCQPVRFAVSRTVSTDLIDTAEGTWQSVELLDARA
jgi:hypothetical protein